MGRHGRITRTAVAGFAALVVAGCSGVPNVIDGSQTAAGGRPGVELGAPGETGFGAVENGAFGDAEAGTATGGTAAGGTGARSTTGGAAGRTATTGAASATRAPGAPVPGSELGNGKGVTDTHITVAFHMTAEQCGQTQSQGDIEYEHIEALVNFFNNHIPFPNGRKIKYTVVDDGGSDVQCQDKARAAGLKIANDIKAFAAIGSSVNPGADAPIVADTVTHNGTMHIGYNFGTIPDFQKRAPYAWGLPKVGDVTFGELAGYIDKRIKHTQYRDEFGVMQPRKWATLFFDTKEGHYLADLNKKNLTAIGIPTRQYFMSGDTGTASQQASALAIQMKNDGINSVIVGVFGAPAFVSTQAFDAQRFQPDNFISDYGAYWFALFNDVYGQGQLARMQGIAIPCVLCSRLNFSATEPMTPENCPACFAVDNGDGMQYAYRKGGGTASDPNQGYTQGWYQMLSMFAIGVRNAGPVLNPQTFAYGMGESQRTPCESWRYYGRDHPQYPSFNWAPEGKWWGTSGFTTLYWVQKQAQFGTHGYFESFDNYLRFEKTSALPKEPSFDTGERGEYEQIVHPQSGLRPDNPKC